MHFHFHATEWLQIKITIFIKQDICVFSFTRSCDLNSTDILRFLYQFNGHICPFNSVIYVQDYLNVKHVYRVLQMILYLIYVCVIFYK